MKKVAAAVSPDRNVSFIDPAPAVAQHLIDVMDQYGIRHSDSTDIQAVALYASGKRDTLDKLFETL